MDAGEVRAAPLVGSARRVERVPEGDQRVANVNVRVYCGTTREKVIGETERTLALSVTDDEFRQLLTAGIPYSVRVPVSDDPTYVKVIAYDFSADLLGAKLITLAPPR